MEFDYDFNPSYFFFFFFFLISRRLVVKSLSRKFSAAVYAFTKDLKAHKCIKCIQHVKIYETYKVV